VRNDPSSTGFRDATEELRHLRRLADLGYLTASVVHDFNNLLTAILCSVELLERDVADRQNPSELARDIRDAAERATGLTRRVLAFLRKEPARPARLDLSASVADLRSLLEMILGRRLRLVLDLDRTLGEVFVDREQLDHVLINLVANARDAMTGGGEVTISTRSVPAAEGSDPTAAPAPSYVALSVTDTGEGMPPEVRERAFERFFTTKEGKGTGLGLASAHRFAKQHGGCMSLHSAPGRGTTVVVFLPRAVPLTPSPSGPYEDIGARGGSEMVAVIEPDDSVRSALRGILCEAGYSVIDAPSGEIALLRSQRAHRPVALVLADATSSGLGARAVVEHLRAAGHPARLLWMSGDTECQLAGHAGSEPPLLRKAFAPNELRRRVREVIDGGPVPGFSAAITS
jgi:CheY-like chemotaxis protein